MPAHISVRLAWHDDGWNGHICKNPQNNTYCVGPHSYPGELIAIERKLDVEETYKGKHCSEINAKEGIIPPCCFSINAFGKYEIYAKTNPPEFFNDGTQPKVWKMPPNSVCTWPYEEMYKEEVKNPDGTYNYEKRRKAADNFFSVLEAKKTLIFYYANYSNPFSENEQNKYVLVGVSRLANPSPPEDQLFYEGCSDETRRKYAEGFVWQRVLISSYPDEGFRIPYNMYRDKPEILERIALFPENPRNFKYAARHISDDEALALVERFIEVAGTLREIGDKTENWTERLSWLNSVVAELWSGRGKYPGMLKVLDYLGFREAIKFYKDKVIQDPRQESVLKQELFDFLRGDKKTIDGLDVDNAGKKNHQRHWLLEDDAEKNLLENVLPRFDLSKEQIRRIFNKQKEKYGLYCTLDEIIENPYVLSEQYIGDGPDDFISFQMIDHGILPSPELGEPNYSDFVKDDARRLRALCVEELRSESQHTFLPAKQVINKINHRLSYLPEWKRHDFNAKYLNVDHEELEKTLKLRDEKGETYVYLKSNFEFEREIERILKELAERKDIQTKKPVILKQWHDWLYSSNNPICRLDSKRYEEIIQEQSMTCDKIFRKPLSIVYGEAGTGKTTIIGAIINAIESSEGKGVCVQLLCPTGKATDRLRELTGRAALTIHSFLASHKWLNDNFSFRRDGTVESAVSTVIIDEASMLDLPLLGTLFRAMNWQAVRRLIFVGDPNQLPPIGTGKVLADVLDWLEKTHPENVGLLKTNVRQMANRLEGKGTGILDLASIYLRKRCSEKKDSKAKFMEEEILLRIQQGGEIDKDLRVIYWDGPEDLYEKIIETIISDFENDIGLQYNEDEPFVLWGSAFKIYNTDTRKYDYTKPEPDNMQLISPYRGEFFGIDGLNSLLQLTFNIQNVTERGLLGGLTYFDKVIQYRNRTKSNPVWAWDTRDHESRRIEVFNGEIGFTKPHAFDKNWYWRNFRPRRFQIIFKRKEHLWVNYNSISDVEENLEPAYAISVHKSQGSEFNKVYFILPKHKKSLLTTELFYTGLTRAKNHCTVFIEEDIAPLLTLNRPEYSQLNRINSSLFEFNPVPEELMTLYEWYEEGKIHKTLADIMVHSKSEVIIANMLFDRGISFKYDIPLFAPDGTFYRPDFIIFWKGEEWYWEHLGMLDKEEYKNHWEAKKEWYEKHGFSQRLIITDEKEGINSKKIEQTIQNYFAQ